jgi:hypothetical protein
MCDATCVRACSNFESVAVDFGRQFYEMLGTNNAALAPLLVRCMSVRVCDAVCVCVLRYVASATLVV